MALGNFSPGAYTATWNSVSLGLINDPIRFRRGQSAQPITVDQYGDSVIDGVYRGGRCFVSMVLAEWEDGVRDAIWPWDQTDFGETGLHGRLLSDVAAALVLTPVASTPAATEGTNTFTANFAILAPGNQVEFLLGNVHRNIPVVFELLMYSSSGTRWFTVS